MLGDTLGLNTAFIMAAHATETPPLLAHNGACLFVILAGPVLMDLSLIRGQRKTNTAP